LADLPCGVAAEAAVFLEGDARAEGLAKHGVVEWPSNADAYALLAAIDATAGRTDKVASDMADLRKQRPDASLAGFAWTRKSDNPRYEAQSGRVYAGLAKAGLK
jgi:hypothetical protein